LLADDNVRNQGAVSLTTAHCCTTWYLYFVLKLYLSTDFHVLVLVLVLDGEVLVLVLETVLVAMPKTILSQLPFTSRGTSVKVDIS